MAQYYNPDFDRMMQGNSIETDEAEILSAVRRVMVEDKVAHPDIVREIAERPTQVQKVAAETAIRVAGARRRVWGYRPRWSHNLAILTIAAFIYSPTGAASVAGLFAVLLLVLYWTFGPERLGKGFAWLFHGYSRIAPAGATALLDWANRCSARAQRVADCLPERWTQGLYLPTFGPADGADLDTVEPFDRLLERRRADMGGKEV